MNANDVGVFGGIAADCYAADDLTRDSSNTSGGFDGMLSPSLATCSMEPVMRLRRLQSVVGLTAQLSLMTCLFQ